MSSKTVKTQEERVLDALQKADGSWVNGQYFLRTMMLSQYHRAIWNLQKRKDRYGYSGDIEASVFTDKNGFKSYRLVTYRLVTGAPDPVAQQMVPSRSHTNVAYAVKRVGDRWECGCPGFRYRGACSHIPTAQPKLL